MNLTSQAGIRDDLVLEGTGVSNGIAIGVVHRHDAEALAVPDYKITPEQVPAELLRFQDAADRAGRQVAQLQAKAETLGGIAGEEMGYLLDAYRQMLHNSRLIRGVAGRITNELINAEAAVQREIEQIARTFAAMEDSYLAARAADMRDLERRLLRTLMGVPGLPFQVLPRRAIILADELTPAETALLDPRRVAGLATVLGGAENHTAIMSRSLGLPAVLGVAGLMKVGNSGDIAIIDGRSGRVIINPSPRLMDAYRHERADFLRERRALARLRDLPAVTTNNVRVTLQANIELPSEVGSVLNAGAEGIGLLRSEFLFMNREGTPSEEEQFQLLKDVVVRMGGRPVTIRTLDVGGDKLASNLGIQNGPNPSLGLRAIRLSLSRPELFRAQLAAILRVSVFGPIRILIPMVVAVEEMRAARCIIEEVARSLRQQGIPVSDPLPPVGAMIETPGAALAADALAQISDFFSIGTNDLTQYTLAIDRADDSVAHLYNPLHPAVLRLIQFSAEAAHRAHISVSVCGEVAGDPRFTALLLGLGIRELSMSAMHLGVIKQRIRSLDLMAATRRARVIMDQSDSARIARLLDGFNDEKA